MKNLIFGAKNLEFCLIATSLVFIALFSSCTDSNDCEDAFETKEFVVNKKYCLSGSDYFTLDSINDSRCPIGAVCVWEGQVAMKTKFASNGRIIDTTLVLREGKTQSYLLGSYKFTPINAYPANTVNNGDLPRRIEIKIEK